MMDSSFVAGTVAPAAGPFAPGAQPPAGSHAPTAELPAAAPRVDDRSLRKIFSAFVAAHMVLWTVTPLVCCPNAPLDSVEMVYWGREWQLGYSKHPPLVGWAAASVMALTGGRMWGLYLVAQLAIAVCFWCAWRLGGEVADRKIALWGVLALEGSLFLTFEGTVFNNNVGLYPFWALSTLFFYWALTRGQTRYWLATGLWVGSGLMCKYSMAALPLVFALFLVFDRRSRAALKRPGPYLALLVAAAAFSPHVWWAASRGFPTLAYAAGRTRNASPLVGRLLCPLSFTVAELLSLSLVFVILLPLAGWRPRLRKLDSLDRWNRKFLLAATFGPFALLLLTSIMANVHFRGMHGSHMWPFVGLTSLFVLELRPGGAAMRRVLSLTVVAGALVATAFAIRSTLAPVVLGRLTRENFPGQQLAAEVEQLWRDRYGCPLSIVGGDSWLAGNVAFYSDDRPRVYEGDCSWLNKEEFRRRGGVVVWDASNFGDELPDVFGDVGPIELKSQLLVRRPEAAHLPAARIGIAFVAPPATALDWLAARKESGAPRTAPTADRPAEAVTERAREASARGRAATVAERIDGAGVKLR